MKKYLFLLVSVFAVAFSVSCSRFEEQANIQKASNYSVTFMCDLSEEAAADATRTHFGIENGIMWSEGDELLFSQVATVAGEPNTVSSASYVLSASCEQLPAMPVSFIEPDEGTDAYYFAVFPSSAYGGKMHDEDGVQCPLLTIPAVQKPSLDNFDPKADVLLSGITDVVSVVNAERFVQLHFTRPSAIGKMRLINIPSEHNLRTVTFSATVDGKTVQVGGTHYYDLTRGDFSRSYDDENCGDIPVVTLDYSELQTPVPANTPDLTVYFFCYPFTLNVGDRFFVTVETDGDEVFTKEVIVPESFPDGIKFERGKGTVFYVNMSSSQNEACVFDGSNSFKYYGSLSDALAYAKTKCSESNPVTVQLTNDMIISDRFDISNTTDNIVLDLNGCTLELNEIYPNVSKGKLAVINSKPATGRIIQYYDGDKSFYITGGEVFFEDGIYIDHFAEKAAIYAVGGVVTFNGGTVDSNGNCLYLSKLSGGDAASAYIYGGTFTSYGTSTIHLKSSQAECHIEGGSFRTKDGSFPIINVLTGMVDINGGYFYVDSPSASLFKRTYASSHFLVNSAYSNKRIDPVFIGSDHTISVLSPSVQHEHGDAMLEYGYEVSHSSQNVVAKTIDAEGTEHFFDDIHEAFIYANSLSDSCTIRLLEDVGYNDDLEVENENCVVKIDLNGHLLQASKLYVHSYSTAVLADSDNGGRMEATGSSMRTVENWGTLTIEGGKVLAATSSAVDNNSTLIINGGEIDGKYNRALVNRGTMTISDGLVKAGVSCITIPDAAIGSLCSVYGGYFSSPQNIFIFTYPDQGEAKIYGGYFSLQPDAGWLAEGKEITSSGDSAYPYMVVDVIPSDPVVQLDTTPYTDIQDAIAAFRSSNQNSTLTLLSDVTTGTTLELVNPSNTLTIDLNGHTLDGSLYVATNLILNDSGTGGKLKCDSRMAITNLRNVTVNAGTVSSRTNAAIYALNGSNTTINGGRLVCYEHSALVGQGTAEITINDGTVSTEHKVAIMLEDSAELTVNDGFVFGVNNCISLAGTSTQATITGGRFYFNDGIMVGNGSATVSGGHFRGPVDTKYLPDSLANRINGNFDDPNMKYQLTRILAGTAEAEVNSCRFRLLTEAMIYAKEASSYPDVTSTVKMLKNQTLLSSVFIQENNDIIFDLNGKEVTVTSTGYSEEDYQHITITGGRLTVEDTAESGGFVAGQMERPCSIITMHNGELVVDGGSFTGMVASVPIIHVYSGANATINGGTFTNGGAYTILNSGAVTINDGSFYMTTLHEGRIYDSYNDGSTLTVNGGYFYNTAPQPAFSGSGEIVINSAVMNTTVPDYSVASGKRPVHMASDDNDRTHMHGSDNLQYEYKVSSNYSASVRHENNGLMDYYQTINEAVDVCNASQDSTTIYLAKATVSSKTLFFRNTNAKMTLDLCSKNLTSHVQVEPNVTFKLLSTDGGGRIYSNSGGDTFVNNKGDVTIDIGLGDITSIGQAALSITSGGHTALLSGKMQSGSQHMAINNAGSLTVNAPAMVISQEYCIGLSSSNDTDVTVINGGDFRCGDNHDLFIRTVNGCTAVVNGGNFFKPVESKYLPDTKANKRDSHKICQYYLVDIEPGAASAEANSCRFQTVPEALEYANLASNETTPVTVKLLKDSGISYTLSNPVGYFIFDLNGKTLTGNSATRPIFQIIHGKFVLKNSAPASGGIVQTNSANSIYIPGGDFILENGVIDQNTSEVAVELSGGRFTMKGGTINQNTSSTAVLAKGGSATFNGGAINSQYICLHVNNSGNAVVNDGVFTALAGAAAHTNMLASRLTINGGSFKSGSSFAVSSIGVITVNGGYFYTGLPGSKPCFKKYPSGTLTINSAYGNTDIDAGYIGAGKTKSACSVVHKHGSEALTYTTKVE